MPDPGTRRSTRSAHYRRFLAGAGLRYAAIAPRLRIQALSQARLLRSCLRSTERHEYAPRRTARDRPLKQASDGRPWSVHLIRPAFRHSCAATQDRVAQAHARPRARYVGWCRSDREVRVQWEGTNRPRSARTGFLPTDRARYRRSVAWLSLNP